MKTRHLFIFFVLLLSAGFLTACGNRSIPTDAVPVGPARTETDIPGLPDSFESGINTLTISCTEGTGNCWSFEGNALYFKNLSSDTVCGISGMFDGCIIIDAGEEYRFELELCGLTLNSSESCPITVLSGDKVILTAKKETLNFIYDTRDGISSVSDANPDTSAADTSSATESTHSAAVFSECDLVIGGKGALTLVSSANNGIHSKKDLKVKNLSLSVKCEDNALKGNDSVTVESGNLTLIASAGDGIKTSDSDISSSGKQRGNITLTDCSIDIYAACDGIDSAFNIEIGEGVILNINTDKYSSYTKDSVETGTADNGPGSIDETKGQNPSGTSDFPGGWNAPDSRENSGGWGNPGGRGGNPGGWGGNPGGWGGGPGGNGGWGGTMGGNPDKSTYSTKGIKAGNEIIVTGGTISVNSYDDAFHATGGVALESGAISTGNVTISGGTLNLYSNDDAIHADGVLTVSNGEINITNCYEGLEGTNVIITGGKIDLISSDDGINATASTGTGITISGGSVYVYAGGDGIDSNSRTSYQGIVFSGGDIIVISTSNGNSSIDTEQGYTYSGGRVLAVCPTGGMGTESQKCKNFSSVATKTTLSLQSGRTLSAKVNGSTELSVQMPCRLSALVIYLGSSDATLSAE